MKRLTLAALVWLLAGAAVAAPESGYCKGKEVATTICAACHAADATAASPCIKARRATQCLYLPSNLGY